MVNEVLLEPTGLLPQIKLLDGYCDPDNEVEQP
jgi:hypothetical protein